MHGQIGQRAHPAPHALEPLAGAEITDHGDEVPAARVEQTHPGERKGLAARAVGVVADEVHGDHQIDLDAAFLEAAGEEVAPHARRGEERWLLRAEGHEVLAAARTGSR